MSVLSATYDLLVEPAELDHVGGEGGEGEVLDHLRLLDDQVNGVLKVRARLQH